MGRFLILLGMVLNVHVTAQYVVDSVQFYGTSLQSSSPFGFGPTDLVPSNPLDTVLRTRENTSLFLALDSSITPTTPFLPSECGGSCLDLRLVCLVYKGNRTDTVGFGRGNTMLINRAVLNKDATLYNALLQLMRPGPRSRFLYNTIEKKRR